MLGELMGSLFGSPPQANMSQEQIFHMQAQMAGMGSISDQLYARQNPIIYTESPPQPKPKKKKEDVMEITADAIGAVKKIGNHFILKAGCEERICDSIKEVGQEVVKLLECQYPEKKGKK